MTRPAAKRQRTATTMTQFNIDKILSQRGAWCSVKASSSSWVPAQRTLSVTFVGGAPSTSSGDPSQTDDVVVGVDMAYVCVGDPVSSGSFRDVPQFNIPMAAPASDALLALVDVVGVEELVRTPPLFAFLACLAADRSSTLEDFVANPLAALLRGNRTTGSFLALRSTSDGVPLALTRVCESTGALRGDELQGSMASLAAVCRYREEGATRYTHAELSVAHRKLFGTPLHRDDADRYLHHNPDDGTYAHPAIRTLEMWVAENIQHLHTRDPNPRLRGLCTVDAGLVPAQIQAIDQACTSPGSVLVGPPGTGKTFTAAALITTILATGCRVHVASPTSVAAHRLYSCVVGNTKGRPDRLQWSTLHRLVYTATGKTLLAQADVIVIDECSMMELDLAAHTLASLRFHAPTATVVFVGDERQLGSIGPGAFLRDLLVAGPLPITRLTEVLRQAAGGSVILHNANTLYGGGAWIEKPGSFTSVVEDDVLKAVREIVAAPENRGKRYEVIGQLNTNTASLNILLQGFYNRDSLEVNFRGHVTCTNRYTDKNYRYRRGDVVVFLRNSMDKAARAEDANWQWLTGERGLVLCVDHEFAYRACSCTVAGCTPLNCLNPTICTTYGALVVVKTDALTLEECTADDSAHVWIPIQNIRENLAPAYANNVFRMQGRECERSIVVLDFAPYCQTTDKLFTALTRAKHEVQVVAQSANVLHQAQTRQRHRRTGLQQALQ